MDIDKLHSDYMENRELIFLLGEVDKIKSRALQVRQKILSFEAARVAAELELDENPDRPDFAAAKAAHADRADSNARALARWDRSFKAD